MPAQANAYVDFRMHEWRMGEQSPRIQASVRKVLSELDPEALLSLKDPKLEVVVLPDDEHGVWASFPIHPRLPLCLPPADVMKALRFAPPTQHAHLDGRGN